MNKLNVCDEQAINQNETVETAMLVVTSLTESYPNFSDVSFYKDGSGIIRLRLEF